MSWKVGSGLCGLKKGWEVWSDLGGLEEREGHEVWSSLGELK